MDEAATVRGIVQAHQAPATRQQGQASCACAGQTCSGSTGTGRTPPQRPLMRTAGSCAHCAHALTFTCIFERKTDPLSKAMSLQRHKEGGLASECTGPC